MLQNKRVVRRGLGRGRIVRACVETIERRLLLSGGNLEVNFGGGGDGFGEYNVSGTGQANAVAIAPNNRVYLVGSDFLGSSADIEIRRLIGDSGASDGSFGSGGVFSFTLGGEDIATDVALDSSRRPVIVGYTSDSGLAGKPNRSFVARITTAGALDTSFGGGDGIVEWSWFGPANTTDDRAEAVAIQDDGRIVVTGSADGGSSDFAVARFNADGSFDTSFSGDGIATNTFGAADFARDVAIEDFTGRIVVAGFTNQTGTDEMAVTRFNPDGTIDLTFGVNGDAIVDAPGNSRAEAVGITSTGGILLGGSSFVGSSADLTVARLSGFEGALVPSYGNLGIATQTFFGEDLGTDLVVERDGTATLVGYSNAGVSGQNIAVVRFDPGGELDDAFSDDGRDLRDFGGDEEAFGVAQDEDGSLLVVGRSDDDYAVLRYRGMYDVTFGDAGQVGGAGGGFIVFGSSTIEAIEPLPATTSGFQGFATAGTTRPGFILPPDPGDSDFLVRQYLSNGNLDTSFSGDGIAIVDFNSGNFDEAYDLARQPDGKLVVVGTTRASSGANGNYAIARFNTNGTLDTSFSFDGLTSYDFGFDDIARSVVILDNGDILVGGSLDGGSADWGFVRLNPDGSLDAGYSGGTFGGPGALSVNVGSEDFLADMAKLPDGRVVAVGFTDRNDPSNDINDFAVLGLRANGTIDPGFNNNTPSGALVFDIEQSGFGGGTDARANEVVIDNQGRILVGGTYEFEQSDDDFAVVRLSPSGQFDTSFGDGSTPAAFTSFIGVGEQGLGLDVDGLDRVYIGGTARFDDDAAIVRLNPDGTRDTSFSPYTSSVSDDLDYQFVFQGNPDSVDSINDLFVDARGNVVLGGTSSASPWLVKIRADDSPQIVASEYVFDIVPAEPIQAPYTRVRFGDSVLSSLALGDFTLRNATTNTVIPNGQLELILVPAANGAELYFEPTPGNFEQLPDGRYELTLIAGQITDAAGNDNVEQVVEFFVLRGDANRDRRVDLADFGILRANFGGPGLFSEGDFNYDGNVDLADFGLLRANFGVIIPGDAPASLFADDASDSVSVASAG